MYMNTRANLDYWSTDNCCLRWSLRTGAITIGILCLLWQALMVAFGVMMIVSCTSTTTNTNTTDFITTTDITTIVTLPDDTSSSDLFGSVSEPLMSGDDGGDEADDSNVVVRDIGGGLKAVEMMKTDSGGGGGDGGGGDGNGQEVVEGSSGGDFGNVVVMDDSRGNGGRRTREVEDSGGSDGKTQLVEVADDGDAESIVRPNSENSDGNVRKDRLDNDIDRKITINTKSNTVINNYNDNNKTTTNTTDTTTNNNYNTSTTTTTTINNISGSNIPSIDKNSSTNSSIIIISSGNTSSTASNDCALNSTDEDDANSTNSNFTCAWLPGPETEVLGVYSEDKLLLVAGLFIAYSGIYCILSLCVVVGSLTNSVSLLHGWVAFTGFHNIVILATLLVPLPFTTLPHLLLSIAYFILSLYTWAVVKSHMHALKVELNKPLLPEGSITDYTVDGVDVTEIPVQV